MKRIKHDIRRLTVAAINRLSALSSAHLGWADERPVYERLGKIQGEHGGQPLARRLLIDGHFLNPGYWYRLQLFRAAVGSAQGDELAFVWRHNTAHCTRILHTLGIRKTATFSARPDPRLRGEAHRLVGGLRCSADLLALRLPNDVPASFLYDAVLKRQRATAVDVTDPLVERDVWEFLSSIVAAENLIDGHRPDLIAMSHVVNTQCAPLAWLGAQQGIPVVVLFGNYGAPKFWRMSHPDDIHFGMDRPQQYDLDTIPAVQADNLAEIGRRYLDLRLSGQTDDLGGRMAYAGNADLGLFDKTGDRRPVVAVYASNWFDYPHALGMHRFRDFLDWIEATLNVALATPSVRWLFRAHPCDKWYGGMTLKDVMPAQLPEHVTLVPDECPGSLVTGTANAVVTYHGTAAIEYAAQGKPVLVPDRGWYHDCGLAVYPESREHYLELLGTDWFNHVDVESAKRRAELFAGWYFCVPDWQAGALMPDDSDRDAAKHRLVDLIENQHSCVRREIELIRAWMMANEQGYHTFKMKRATGYSLSNISG